MATFSNKTTNCTSYLYFRVPTRAVRQFLSKFAKIGETASFFKNELKVHHVKPFLYSLLDFFNCINLYMLPSVQAIIENFVLYGIKQFSFSCGLNGQ